MPLLTTISMPVITKMTEVVIENLPSLTNINNGGTGVFSLPTLVTGTINNGGGVWTARGLVLNNLPLITSLYLPVLNASSISLTYLPQLSSISIPSMVYSRDTFVIANNMTSLTNVNFLSNLRYMELGLLFANLSMTNAVGLCGLKTGVFPGTTTISIDVAPQFCCSWAAPVTAGITGVSAISFNGCNNSTSCAIATPAPQCDVSSPPFQFLYHRARCFALWHMSTTSVPFP
jgi:hypothetical protein